MNLKIGDKVRIIKIIDEGIPDIKLEFGKFLGGEGIIDKINTNEFQKEYRVQFAKRLKAYFFEDELLDLRKTNPNSKIIIKEVL